MSYQLLATKRKFQRLLDQIADPSLVTTSLTPGDGSRHTSPLEDSATDVRNELEPTAKRRRLQHDLVKPAVRERSYVIKSSPHLALLLAQQARLRRWGKKELEDESRGGYQPTSRPAFLDRLKSFSSVLEWSNKPPEINEIQWARRGWRLHAVETVRCEVCQIRVVIDLGSSHPVPASQQVSQSEGPEALKVIAADLDEDLDQEASYQHDLARKYKERIVEAHSEGCPWRRLGCNDSIYKIKIFPAWESASLLAERYKRFIRNSDVLPAAIDGSASIVDFNATFHALCCLYPDPEQGVNDPSYKGIATGETALLRDPHLRALGLALSGWDVAYQGKDDGVRFIECRTCFRRVAPWLLQNNVPDDDEGSRAQSFDLTSEHREHCPWQNPTTQCPDLTEPSEARTATEQLANSVITLALSKLQRIEDGSVPTGSYLPTGHPSRILVERLKAQTSHKQQGEPLLSQQYLTSSLDKEDEERQNKLNGLRRFLNRFKDFGHDQSRP